MKKNMRTNMKSVVVSLLILSIIVCGKPQIVHASIENLPDIGPNGPGSNPVPQQTVERSNQIETILKFTKEDFSVFPDSSTPSASVEHYQAELKPGESTTFNLSYTVPEAIFDRGDIMFVFDRTGSMSGQLSTAQANALSIMNDIRTQLPYAWFGVASFMDYPSYYEYPGYSNQYGDASYGDQPWIPGIDPTDKVEDVSNIINALTLGSGADGPECYTRVLYELQFSNWRAGSKKVVVLFGDAPTHDLDFAGYNNGGDPGRNGIANDDDDLDFETVVSQLNNEGISVIAINSGYGSSIDTFKGMSVGYAGASGTGGLYYQLSDTSDLPEKVVELIEAETGTIDRLEVKIPEEFAAWINVIPAYYENLSPTDTVEFEIKVTVPEGTEPGFYPFIGNLKADQSDLDTFLYFEITVPGGSGDLDLGFNPKKDGYSFENFGEKTLIGTKNKYYTQLSWDMFETFFGTENVEHTNGDPLGMAQYYYDHTYKTIGAGGNCTGFSVTSIFNYMDFTPSNMGKYALKNYERLWKAKLSDPEVRDAIEFAQGIQLSTEIQAARAGICTLLDNSPLSFFNYLKSLFENGQPAEILILNNREGGHSLLPYRLIEDLDNKINYIYVYDSNDPQQWWDGEKRIEIDTTNNTWSYSSNDTPYSGDSKSCNLIVSPIDLFKYSGVPMWNNMWTQSTASPIQSTTSIEYRYFVTDGLSRLLFIDDLGNRFGWQDGVFYNEIRGAIYIPKTNTSVTDEGTYVIPAKLKYQLALIGSGEGVGSLDYWHGDIFFGLREIELTEGSMASIAISEIDRIIEVQNLVGEIRFDLMVNSLKVDQDLSLHLTDVVVEAGSFVRISFEPVSELTAFTDDTWVISTGNLSPHTLGVGLVHRGGIGFSSFSNPEVEMAPNSMGSLSVPDWQDMMEINFDTDLDGDGIPDTSQTLPNMSQASSVELQADRIQVYCGNTIKLIAILKDSLGIPINNGTTIEFSTTLGSLSTTTGVTSAGRVEIDLANSSGWGIATITASVPETDVSTSITVEFIPFSSYLPVMISE